MSSSFKAYFVNALTFSRVPLIFGFMISAVVAHRLDCPCWGVVACVLLTMAGLSDLFDGKLARKWQVVSTFGKLADPLMDKVFFIVSFPTLLWLIGAQGDNPVHALVMLAFTVLYILRDQWVTFLRAVASSYHADVSAMWLGKVRTALSFPAAGYIYLYLAFRGTLPTLVGDAALAASIDHWMLVSVYVLEASLIVLNVYSCIVYTRVYWPYLVRAIGAR